MDISLKGNYKSLTDFNWKGIPNLAVLTGLNGSGKTQLLELVQMAYQNLSQTKTGNVLRLPGYEVTIENSDFKNAGILSWNSYGGHFQFEQYKFRFNDLQQIIELVTLALNPSPSTPVGGNQAQQDHTYEYSQTGIGRLKHIIEQKQTKIIKELLVRTGKRQAEILPRDILFHLPDDILFEDHDVINQDYLDMVFFLYMYKKISLERNGKDPASIGAPPWKILNEVISTAGLPYHFTSPNEEPIAAIFEDPLNKYSAYHFSVELVNEKKEKIGVNNLSSGEKIILSLAMLLYYFQYRKVRKSMLILDEVDAHLHPSLTKQFFDVVNQNIIREYGVQVLMATHSPSTVALAPKDSLFIVERRSVGTSIRKASKDAALNLLMSGVPSLSIDYENRRQIFVESQYDAEFYDAVYNATKNKLTADVSLNFISSGVKGRGSCDQVEAIVKELNGFGNKSIFGIVDWDRKNKSSRSVRVLGEGKRYSMDSYVFDPLVMSYFLYREKIVINSDLGLPETFRLLDFRDLKDVDAQRMADLVIAIIQPKFKDTANTSRSDVSYLNGLRINLPDWFLTNYGHELWKIYTESFPPLNRFKDENGLRRAVIRNTIGDLPEFIPVDLLNLMEYFHSIEVHDESV